MGFKPGFTANELSFSGTFTKTESTRRARVKALVYKTVAVII
jgi:hypothetical protein